MDSPPMPDDPRSGYVYRRIHPHGWNARKDRPKESAFIAKPDLGLSVFRADLCTPRQVLEHGIEAARAMATSTDDEVQRRGEKQLGDFGDTVEAWLKNGWKVVRVPIAAFTQRGFTLDQPDDQGHQSVFGDYALHSLDLALIADLLSDEECVA